MSVRVAMLRAMWLVIEFVLLFFGLVGAYIWLEVPGGPIPALLVAGAVMVAYLWRQPDFDRRDLLRGPALRPALPRILALWAGVAVATAVTIALTDPDRLFERPRFWLVIVVLYPLLSVYPQELIFRAFLLHRYAPVLGTGRRAAAASAAAFGFAHLLFGNVLAVVATLLGGWLFARRYQATRSLLTVSVEHALYGVLIFTIGLGDLFYHAV